MVHATVSFSDVVRNWILEPVLSKLDALEAEMSLTTDAIIALDLKLDELKTAIDAKLDQTQTVAALTQVGAKAQALVDQVNAL